jgi:14-3-3 protein epsilon
VLFIHVIKEILTHT